MFEFQRFHGFWTRTVSMDFSCLYASSSSLYCLYGNILLHVLQLVDFKALASTGFYRYSMAIMKANDPTCILAWDFGK